MKNKWSFINRAMLILALVGSLGATITATDRQDTEMTALCVVTLTFVTLAVVTEGMPVLVSAAIGGAVYDSVTFVKEHTGETAH